VDDVICTAIPDGVQVNVNQDLKPRMFNDQWR